MMYRCFTENSLANIARQYWVISRHVSPNWFCNLLGDKDLHRSIAILIKTRRAEARLVLSHFVTEKRDFLHRLGLLPHLVEGSRVQGRKGDSNPYRFEQLKAAIVVESVNGRPRHDY